MPVILNQLETFLTDMNLLACEKIDCQALITRRVIVRKLLERETR